MAGVPRFVASPPYGRHSGGGVEPAAGICSRPPLVATRWPTPTLKPGGGAVSCHAAWRPVRWSAAAAAHDEAPWPLISHPAGVGQCGRCCAGLRSGDRLPLVCRGCAGPGCGPGPQRLC